jgi:hypothetical protein
MQPDDTLVPMVPDSLERAFADASGGVVRTLDALRGELDRFDPTLAAALDKSRAKILYQIEKIRHKSARETLRRDDRAAADARRLSGLLYPHRHLQERFYTILPFLAGHGLELIDQLYESVQPDCPDHRVLTV